ncbi:MAG: KUP/HAK/KT family potassium transporter [Bacilli bacterium]|jgi:KUP system potassium uptake protein|nr:KUP/HAK/KT family potassium transporter [Bacilli bacterium]
MSKDIKKKLKLSGILVALGIVYGDIGTSPLYVMKSIVQGQGGLANISENFIIGSVSLILWTITILTTIKYVTILLNADNNGEGGIFSLFLLVRKKAKYLLIPAAIGGATLLADSVLTPAVTITSSAEGLKGIPLFANTIGDNQNIIVVISLTIITLLFLIQRFGTDFLGKSFGPIMFIWFTFIGLIGLSHLIGNLEILKAINPYYAIELLSSPGNKMGIFILGSIFLATTGAEDLYADLGHVGKKNIRLSWPYVKLCLILSYFGQAAWLLSVKDNPSYLNVDDLNPFFAMVDDPLKIFSVVIATIAAIIASQALISGSFSLVSIAIKLRLLPKLKTHYPSREISQVYLPSVALLLWIGTCFVVLFFKYSSKMEAAYGLSITITMLMSTCLLFFYLRYKNISKKIAFPIVIFFGSIETLFFISCAVKFLHGGYIAVIIALLILSIIAIWHYADVVVKKYTKLLDLRDYKDQLLKLRNDTSYNLLQTNLVYLTTHLKDYKVRRNVISSILDRHPKRASVYWFVSIEVDSAPYTKYYEIDMLDTDYIVIVKLHLGFKLNQNVTIYLRRIIRKLIDDGRLAPQTQKFGSVSSDVGDFRYILIEERLSNNYRIDKLAKQIIQMKLTIKKFTTSPAKWFGLEFSEYTTEIIPLIMGKRKEIDIIEHKKKVK